ncbi:MAG TPA: ATP synthase F1 subunit gamma [Armatimonadota bacterium]|nr:ATP synthase F1 subunit gamma [Armatimonadota bacterium]
MLSTRAIRRKIRTVRNIRKITDAMRMVSAARLQRVQAKVSQARPYADKMAELLRHVAPHAREVSHPLLEVRQPARRVALVAVSADRGLCGSFNSNIIRWTSRFLAEQTVPVELITIGRKVGSFFARRNVPIREQFTGISADSTPAEISVVSSLLRSIYEDETVDEVHILYTEFVNAVVQRPKIMRFLPFEAPAEMGQAEGRYHESEYLFEPSARAVMESLIPRYVDTMIYHLLLESTASEHGARMMAMSNASTNAGELIDHLTLQLNKARQSSITGELLEIVAGADALAKQ